MAPVRDKDRALQVARAQELRPLGQLVGRSLQNDLAMPQQSGFWLITKIRQLYPDQPIPVLAVTGHPFPADGIRRAGFDEVMQKPPDPDVLCTKVGALARARDGARS